MVLRCFGISEEAVIDLHNVGFLAFVNVHGLILLPGCLATGVALVIGGPDAYRVSHQRTCTGYMVCLSRSCVCFLE